MEITHVEQERRHVGNLTGETELRLDHEIHLAFHAQEKQRILQAIAPLRRAGQRVILVVERTGDGTHRELVTVAHGYHLAAGIPIGQVITRIAEVDGLSFLGTVTMTVTRIQNLHIDIPVNIHPIEGGILAHLKDGVFGNRHHHTVIGQISIDGIALIVQAVGIALVFVTCREQRESHHGQQHGFVHYFLHYH